MMHMGDILSTVWDIQFRGGYHDKCGGYCILRTARPHLYRVNTVASLDYHN